MIMYTSIAVGGPRDALRLTAPGSWDGIIRKPHMPAHGLSRRFFYPGRYLWISSTGWVWHAGTFRTVPGFRRDLACNWYLALNE